MIEVAQLVHPHSYAQQGIRSAQIDPAAIIEARPVRLHPCAAYTEGLQLKLAGCPLSLTIAGEKDLFEATERATQNLKQPGVQP